MSQIVTVQRGHVYQLPNKVEGFQTLTFFKDLPHSAEDNHDGVLTQTVIRAVLARMLDLFGQVPCEETMRIIEHQRLSLEEFETRAFRRTLQKCYAKCGLNIEELPVQKNGHVFDLTK